MSTTHEKLVYVIELPLPLLATVEDRDRVANDQCR